MAEELNLAFEEDAVADVAVDAVELSEDEAERLLNPPPPPPPPPPPRPSSPSSAAQAARQRRAARVKEKKPELTFKEILFRPHEWIQAIAQFVLYSGMTKNNPLIVTLRMLMLAMPIIMSIVLSYWSMSVIMGGGKKELSGGVVSTAGGSPVVSVGGQRITVPLPDGMETMDVAALKNYRLTDRAIDFEKANVLVAARPTDPETRSSYFATIATSSAPGAAATDAATFQKELKRFKEMKNNQGALLVGSDVFYPYDETPNSISFGLYLRTVTGDSLVQYSSLVFTKQNRPVLITYGYISNEENRVSDQQGVKEELAAWRDKILAQ